jgi:hypothetical protein
LDKKEISQGESVTGFGHLVPGMANTSIMLTYVKPDGSVEDVQVATFEKGAFNFTCTPDVAGNWTVAAQWQPDRGYYTSAFSEPASIEVTLAPTSTLTSTPNSGPNAPIAYVYAAVVAIVIAVVLALALAYMKRKKR